MRKHNLFMKNELNDADHNYFMKLVNVFLRKFNDEMNLLNL